MAVTLTLSPFPAASSAAARAAAIDYLQENCGGRCVNDDGTGDDDTTCQLGALAAELVELAAPGAPQTIRNEACTRIVGYLATADYGARSQESQGSLQVSYTANHSAMFKNSGAEALLLPWTTLYAESV